MVVRYLVLVFAWALLVLPASQLFGQAPSSQQVPDELVTKQELKNEVMDLKERQDLVLKSVTESNKYTLWIFSILGGIIAIFSFFQTFNDTRTMKVLREHIKKSEEITTSYQKNIESSTRLVDQIEKVVKFQADAQKMLAQIKILEDKDANVEQHWEGEINQLNKIAMQLSLDFKRNSHNQSSFQQRIRAFFDKYEIIQSSTETEDKLNANCHYIIGMYYYRILNKYKEAIENLGIAIQLAQNHSERKALYPSLSSEVSLSTWLGKLQNVCHFHSAIIKYNLGDYGAAIHHFKFALESDEKDYQSLTYIPEAMFLEGKNYIFNQIITEFREVLDILEALDTLDNKKNANTKEQLLAQAYLKLGNCYLGTSKNPSFNEHKSLELAQKYIQKAYDLDSGSTIINYSLGQVLFEKYAQERSMNDKQKQEYIKHFLYAFKAIKKKVGQITEAKILMMYYYILAICSIYGEIENEIPQIYIMRIFELRPRLPEDNNLRIYSPLTKNDLTVDEFIVEVEDFQINLAEKTTTKPTEVAFQSKITRRRKHLRA